MTEPKALHMQLWGRFSSILLRTTATGDGYPTNETSPTFCRRSFRGDATARATASPSLCGSNICFGRHFLHVLRQLKHVIVEFVQQPHGSRELRPQLRYFCREARAGPKSFG